MCSILVRKCLLGILVISSVLALARANPVYPNEAEDYDGNEEVNAVDISEFLQRLAAARNQAYDNYGNPSLMVSDMLRDRRRASTAENNFQLRVRKRSQDYSPLAAESNFQLRVRKSFLDRLRQNPQLRSAAEDNFQLRVRRKPSTAEQNFQLRVRRSNPMAWEAYQRQARMLNQQNLLEKIRDRRFGQQVMDDNFQLRVRRSAELMA